METEELLFKISLSGTYYNKVPEYSIILDEKIIKRAVITQSSDVIETVDFTTTLSEGPHQLIIRLENKESSDTITDGDLIISDMLLNIKDIEIDEISLGQVLWDSTYILDEPQLFNGIITNSLEQCTNLGWNGSYVLNISSPFYIWLLEQL